MTRSTVEYVADGGTDRAAAMAYYAIQSLFPGLLVVVLVSLLASTPESVTGAVDWAVRQGMDKDLGAALRRTLQNATERASGGVRIAVVIATVTALSSASGWLAAVGRAIEPDAERRVGRNPVTGRIRFSIWTLVLIILVVAALSLLAAIGGVSDTIFRELGVTDGAPLVWDVLQPLLVLAGIVGAMLILFRIAPDRIVSPRWRHLLPGALLAGLGWVIATGGFVFYVRNLASLGATYGAFATPIILLLWLWLSGVVVLLGAALNTVLDERRRGPHGPVRLEGADDPEVAGHPLGAIPQDGDADEDKARRRLRLPRRAD